MATCPQFAVQIGRASELESKAIRLRAHVNQLEREIAELKKEFTPHRMALEIAQAHENSESGIIPLEVLEKQAILRAVELKSVPVAAKLLGIGKTTLYRKLHEYGFDVRTFKAEDEAAA